MLLIYVNVKQHLYAKALSDKQATNVVYEDCSNTNASSFITFFTYTQQQIETRFYRGLCITFKLASDLKKNTVYLSSYSPLNVGHVSILTNSML